MTDLEKLKKYLTENNNEIMNKYIKGYMSAAEITKNIGVTRNLFYLVDVPDMVEKKAAYEKEVMNELVKRINRVLPFETMRIDKKCLFGTEDFSHLSNTVQKDKVRKKRNMKNIPFDKGFGLTIQSKITVWYRNYLMNEERKRGTNTVYSIAKMYGHPKSKIYETMKFFEENEAEGRFIMRIPLEEQEVFLENIKMFEAYQNGSSIKEISEKWDVEELLVEEVIESLSIAKENLLKPRDRKNKAQK